MPKLGFNFDFTRKTRLENAQRQQNLDLQKKEDEEKMFWQLMKENDIYKKAVSENIQLNPEYEPELDELPEIPQELRRPQYLQGPPTSPERPATLEELEQIRTTRKVPAEFEVRPKTKRYTLIDNATGEKLGDIDAEQLKILGQNMVPTAIEKSGKIEMTGEKIPKSTIVKKQEQAQPMVILDSMKRPFDLNGNALKEIPPNAYIAAVNKDLGAREKNIQKLGIFMANLKTLFEDVPSASGVAGRVVGVGQEIKAAIGEESNLKVYNDYKKVVLGQIVSTIGGESASRISDQDVKRMEGAMPNAMATTEERDTKWKLFFNLANQMAQQYGASPIFDEQGNLIDNKTIIRQSMQQINTNTLQEGTTFMSDLDKMLGIQ